MGYRDNISDQVDINEGLLEISQESLAQEELAAEFVAALDEADAEMKANAIDDVVNGVEWFNRKQMTLPRWAEALEEIGATPEQRRLYEQAKQEEASSRHEFMEDYADDLDRYPEGDYHT
ncbi:MAG: hypothetical protein JWM07_202 [Candidatus Saccharibacteria bacterium]|nr:hypothetical protein [Candidatus Saccharibacteria bacterium]